MSCSRGAIDSAIGFELIHSQHQHPIICLSCLSPPVCLEDKWQIMAEMQDGLKPFEGGQKLLEGNTSVTGSLVLLGVLDHIVKKLAAKENDQ